jgi:hypothetical protein
MDVAFLDPREQQLFGHLIGGFQIGYEKIDSAHITSSVVLFGDRLLHCVAGNPDTLRIAPAGPLLHARHPGYAWFSRICGSATQPDRVGSGLSLKYLPGCQRWL